ncbi:23S rRNA (adenine(2030)-N(6))-methyltransferase RlmJ [bacterium]|nr:23S rRNA (adenine(2030)-N(6))-methyltransferase RlmJ [bacterium]
MPYRHYGNLGDIWKHLPLCSFLVNEEPQEYIESNAAFSLYRLEGTPEQEYGIFTFLTQKYKSDIICGSSFVNYLVNFPDNHKEIRKYLGSPALAMTSLKVVCDKYWFCDIEGEPLTDIMAFASFRGIRDRVATLMGDSLQTLYPLLDQWGENSFMFIDPYFIFEDNEDGKCYFDLFLEATRRKIKTVLWYGFTTRKMQREIHQNIMEKLGSASIDPAKYGIKASEIMLKIIEEDTIVANPGILGCGVMISNLSRESQKDLELLGKELVKIYEGTKLFDKYPGDLVMENLELR